MKDCSVSQVPNEIGNLVLLKELDLSSNTFSSLPDTLSGLSQLVYLNIGFCQQLRLLPLLPSNLKNIDAIWCDSLDVMSSASIHAKVCKESPFSNSFVINLLLDNLLDDEEEKKVPEWCGYQSREGVLSFVAPVHHLLDNNICGIILWVQATSHFPSNPKMYNVTKNTGHRFKTTLNATCLISYNPLDDTTLVVEPGDSVLLKFPQETVLNCGLRLIYESDVVDGILVFSQTVTKPYPLGDCPLVLTLSNAISDDS